MQDFPERSKVKGHSVCPMKPTVSLKDGQNTKVWTEGVHKYIKDSCQKDWGIILATWWDPQLSLPLPTLLASIDMSLLRVRMQELITSHFLLTHLLSFVLYAPHECSVGKREIKMRIKMKREDCHFFHEEQIAGVWHFSHTSWIVLGLGFLKSF